MGHGCGMLATLPLNPSDEQEALGGAVELIGVQEILGLIVIATEEKRLGLGQRNDQIARQRRRLLGQKGVGLRLDDIVSLLLEEEGKDDVQVTRVGLMVFQSLEEGFHGAV